MHIRRHARQSGSQNTSIQQTVYSGFLLQIVAKAEFLNPGGSVKDRVALHIIQDAFAQERLTEGGLITEGTAGSTGRHPSVKV